MKIISPDNYGVRFESTGIDENYPITNLENDYPRKVTKGNSSTLLITVQITTGGNAIGIAYTNATSVECDIRTEPKGIDWETNSSAIDWNAKTRGIVWKTGSAAAQTVTHDISASEIGRAHV